MAHLAQDAPVRTGDAFDRANRTVGVPGDVAARVALQVHVLRGNLAIGGQLGQRFVVRHKAALAMGYRHRHHIPGL